MIICDPGSTHLGNLVTARALTIEAANCGCSAIKWQLLSPAEEVGGNINLTWDWLPELIDLGKDHGIEVFASVFNYDGVLWLHKCGVETIKLAFSQQHIVKDNLVVERREPHVAGQAKKVRDVPFKTIYRSSGLMNEQPPWAINLYCIPEYPVKYQVDFEGIFSRFQGFSSHCLGIDQDRRAIDSGAQVIEKHFTLSREGCPDAKFALMPREMEKLCKYDTDHHAPKTKAKK